MSLPESLLSPNLLLAILINVAILLVTSWVIFFFALNRMQKEKQALIKRLSALMQQHKSVSLLPPDIEGLPEEYPSGIDESLQNCAKLGEDIESGVREVRYATEEQVRNLEEACDLAATTQPDDEDNIKVLRQKLAMMKAQAMQNQDRITYLENQISNYRYQLSELEERTEQVKAFAKRINGLERQQSYLRQENIRLRNGFMLNANDEARKLATENQRLNNRLDSYEQKHRKSEQQVIVLRRSLEQMKETMAATQRALEESKVKSAKPVDDYAIDELKSELENTRREKQFLEEQYLELLEGPDGLIAVTSQLDRVQREHAMLEMSYLEMFEEAAANGNA